MSRRPPGQPGRLVSWFRTYLLGRKVEDFPWYWRVQTTSSRFTQRPNLPPGVANKLASNHYYTRDQRRAVTTPTLVSNPGLLQEATENVTSEEVAYPQITTPPLPGVRHQWTEIKN